MLEPATVTSTAGNLALAPLVTLHGLSSSMMTEEQVFWNDILSDTATLFVRCNTQSGVELSCASYRFL